MGITRDEAVTLVENRLGQKTGLSTNIIAEIKFAQARREANPFLPWFLKKISTVATIANTQTIAVPTGFLKECPNQSRGALYLVDGSTSAWTQLKKGNYDEYAVEYSTIAAGKPKYYSLLGSSFYLFPTPSIIYSARLIHFGADAILTSDVTNLWLTNAPDLIVADAGIQIALQLRDQNAAAAFLEMMKKAEKDMYDATTAREMNALPMELGG